MGNAYHYFYNLVNASGNTLAYLGPITNDDLGTYSVYWDAYN